MAGLVCEADISAIVDQIGSLDKSIRDQVEKKIEKVKQNPEIGERKRYGLSGPDLFAVKVNRQRIVMVYRYEKGSPCRVVFVLIASHDLAYRGTYQKPD